MRAIDADALLKSMEDSAQELRTIIDSLSDEVDKGIAKGQLISFLECKMRTREAPTLDDLRPKGRWERKEDGKVYCSVCQKKALEVKKGVWNIPNFCNHCGADMRGGGEDA